MHCVFIAAWAVPTPQGLSPSCALGSTSFFSRPVNLLSSSSSQLHSLVSATSFICADRMVSQLLLLLLVLDRACRVRKWSDSDQDFLIACLQIMPSPC